MNKGKVESDLAELVAGTSKGVDVKLSNGLTVNIKPTKCKYRDLAWGKFSLLKETSDYSQDHQKQVKNYKNLIKMPLVQEYLELSSSQTLLDEDAKRLEALESETVIISYKNTLDKLSEISEKMVGEYVIAATDSEDLHRGLALIIQNDDEKVHQDKYKQPTKLQKLLGRKAKEKSKEERLWYVLYSTCTDEDNYKIMKAWREVNDPTVFFYTMTLIQGQNPLKAQSHQKQ